MDKIKDIPGQVKDAVVNQVAKAGIKPIQEPQDLFQKMFDNVVSIIILVGVLFLLVLAFMSTQTFFANNKINSIQKAFPDRSKLKSIEFHSESGQEEEIDEIDITKHKLCDVQICSSSKSYLLGRQLLDYGSSDMLIQVLKMGAKFMELDLFTNKHGEIIVTNGIRAGDWKLTLNSIPFLDICQKLANFVFNSDIMDNYQDPLILFLNINIKKDRCNEVADILTRNFRKFFLPSQFSMSGKENILDLTLDKLLGKMIIMTSGAIGNTELDNIVNLRLGDKLRRLYFNELDGIDKNEMLQYNKHHLTIVHPPIGFRSINYNPEKAFEYGCQIVAMFFQRADDFLQEYLAHFSIKSYRIKPFEFTRFHDLPTEGYDSKKIAYYNTYDNTIDDLKSRLGPTDSNLAQREKCCQTMIDDSYFSLDKIDRTKVSSESIDYEFNTIRVKLQKLNIAEHEDIYDIERLSESDTTGLDKYKERHVFSESVRTEIIQNKFDLIYFILTKQLNRALSKERQKLFTSDYEDKCIDLDKNQCTEEPICYPKIMGADEKCSTSVDILPFPQFCMPKYEVPNRASCYDDPELGKDPSTYDENDKKKKRLKTESIRAMFHKTMTEHRFFGKWTGKDGTFEIPKNSNSYCEFTFTTPADKKEYKMYLVNYEDGHNIKLDNFSTMEKNKFRAKGVFIDHKLRQIEKTHNLEKLPYHGYADFKILPSEEIETNYTNFKELNKCFSFVSSGAGLKLNQMNTNVDVLLGVFKYLQPLPDYRKYKYKQTDDSLYLINRKEDKVYTTEPFDIENYHYSMIDSECNLQIQEKFDRLPKMRFAPALDSEDIPFSKDDLSPIFTR